MSIAENIKQIRSTLPANMQLVCVSKYHTQADILEAYEAGERLFGESRAQELSLKAQNLPHDIQWHFLGHLQRNKAKAVCEYATMIQSVDSWRLMETINNVASRTIDILLEVHVAKEDTKSGMSTEELLGLLQEGNWKDLHNIRIRGLMGMATLTEDKDEILKEFQTLKVLFDKIKNEYFSDSTRFDTLSMGMSDDYPIAIKAGSTMVRIGSKIFGERQL